MGQPFFSRLLKAASCSAPEIEAGQPCIRHWGNNTATAVVETVLAQLVRQLQTLGWVAQDPMAKSHSVLTAPVPTPPPSTPTLQLHPLVDALAARIRDCRDAMPELRPLAVDPDLEAISSTLDGEALFIRNELHQCRGLRKLHLETARLGLGLQILHCVFFPDPRYDLPVFGADIVASPAGISAAIVDLSPVLERLPAAVEQPLAALTLPPFEQVRELPAWGTIFSPYVRFIRPVNSTEEGWFVDLVERYLSVLRNAAVSLEPDASDAASTIERYQGQLSYCLQQKRNDKTRRVLEKAFSVEWADRYIEELLFDNPPAP